MRLWEVLFKAVTYGSYSLINKVFLRLAPRQVRPEDMPVGGSMDYYLGQIGIYGFNFAPRGWALCAGSLLPITQYTALYSLIGTTYGGDGQTTFALPDLQGRVPFNYGQGAGLTNYQEGQAGGTESTTIAK